MPDEEVTLLLRLRRSDDEALADLYARVGPQVLALAQRLLGSREEAEEVLQDTFARLSARAGQYRPELGSPRAFIYTVARNEALSRLRARRARPQAADPELAPLEGLRAPAPDLDTRIMVQGALDQLPEHDQHLLREAFFLGLSQFEIAEAQNLPLGTVKSRLRRAMQAMRRRLEGT